MIVKCIYEVHHLLKNDSIDKSDVCGMFRERVQFSNKKRKSIDTAKKDFA